MTSAKKMLMRNRCAVVNTETGVAVNVIAADPQRDEPPNGHVLIPLRDGQTVRKGWRYTAEMGLLDPEIEARAFDDRVAAKAWPAEGRSDVRRTTDESEINRIFQASFGNEWDYAAGFAKHGGPVFVNEARTVAIAVSPKSATAYEGITAISGSATKDEIAGLYDRIAHWLFINTDCLLVRSTIAKRLASYIDIAKRSAGRVDESGDPVLHEYLITDWARAIGPKRAVQLVRDAGQTGKAKLMADKIKGAV